MNDYILTFVGTGFSVLLAGNLFFIKRLIDKIEQSSKAASDASAAAANADQSVRSLSNQMREIKSEIKDLRRVEIDVAILKHQMGLARRDEPTGA